MLEFLLIAGVLGLVLSSSKSESGGGGGLPLSGRPRSDCPSATQLPTFSGSGKGEIADMPPSVRSAFEDALNADYGSGGGEGEAGKAAREAAAGTVENLGLAAECAGYLGAAERLYKKAKDVRAGKRTTTDAATRPEDVASTATTPETMAADFAELPKDIRDYVMAFVYDPRSTPGEFEAGAKELVQAGPPAKAATTGVRSRWLMVGAASVPVAAPAAPALRVSGADVEGGAEVGAIDFSRFEPAVGPDPSSGDAPDAPSDFKTFSVEARKKWYYPRAAARLRKIAAEKRASEAGALKVWRAGLISGALGFIDSLADDPIERALDEISSASKREEVKKVLTLFRDWDLDLTKFPYGDVDWLREQAVKLETEHGAMRAAEMFKNIALAIEAETLALSAEAGPDPDVSWPGIRALPEPQRTQALEAVAPIVYTALTDVESPVRMPGGAALPSASSLYSLSKEIWYAARDAGLGSTVEKGVRELNLAAQLMERSEEEKSPFSWTL